eukprot:scaffold1050_cov130-Isochrysis_galbana.AAC.4
MTRTETERTRVEVGALSVGARLPLDLVSAPRRLSPIAAQAERLVHACFSLLPGPLHPSPIPYDPFQFHNPPDCG